MRSTMTTNGKTRDVKNLGALQARIRKTRIGARNPLTSFKNYACATFVCASAPGENHKLVVCGADENTTWRYETEYASLAVFNQYTRKFLELHGATVVVLGEEAKAA